MYPKIKSSIAGYYFRKRKSCHITDFCLLGSDDIFFDHLFDFHSCNSATYISALIDFSKTIMIIWQNRIRICVIACRDTELNIRILFSDGFHIRPIPITGCDDIVAAFINQLLKVRFYLSLCHIINGHTFNPVTVHFFHMISCFNKIIGIRCNFIPYKYASNLQMLFILPGYFMDSKGKQRHHQTGYYAQCIYSFHSFCSPFAFAYKHSASITPSSINESMISTRCGSN